MPEKQKPVVLVTGAAGKIGSLLTQALGGKYTIAGFDRPGTACDIEMDITSEQSVKLALREFRERYGVRIAAVVHLAAYFDFTGETSPLYHEVNVAGTQRLLKALQDFEVERFIFSSSMLVHQPGHIGETISEESPIAPQWAYPYSKAETEEVIRRHHGHIPYLILRLAGLYDDSACIPTLAHQIARIYERTIESTLYAGDPRAGQACIHCEDLIALFESAIERRNKLPEQVAVLAGEAEAVSYKRLQQIIGQSIHGVRQWKTLPLPKILAKAGAWLQQKAEPWVPDDFDQGEKPFIRPFMIDIASHHYALNIGKAYELLGWQPHHRIERTLPRMIAELKKNPVDWYECNGINPPDWMQAAAEKQRNAEDLRLCYEADYRYWHHKNLWAHLLNIGLGFWLIASPYTFAYQSPALIKSDIVSGIVVVLLGFVSLSAHQHLRKARWALGVTGLWLLFAPLLFWAPTAATYLNDTIIGMLIIGFALVTRPIPSMSPLAAMTGPLVPPGWDFSSSSWLQRLLIIVLAFIGFYISRYMAAYQLGHIDSVWEPFFQGALPDGKNGTEEIITSRISEAWPVPDAGLGGLVYVLEILTGMMGSSKRWRTMPWLVLLFGFLIIPLGIVSITFIIIQPIMLDTWCTLCLIAATAMLLQIPYSFDEIIATLMFLKRRVQSGRPLLCIVFTGDTDEGDAQSDDDEKIDSFARPVSHIIKDMLTRGISVSWRLTLCVAIGVWLMFTRITLDNAGNMANADHLIGALVLTVTVIAFAEVMRPLRFLNVFLGMALLITPFIFSADIIATLASLACGLALIVLSVPRGEIRGRYGEWNKVLI